MRRDRGGFLLLLFALAAGGVLAVLCLDDDSAARIHRTLAGLTSRVLYSPLHTRIFDMILTADFFSVIALTLLLERLIPTRPQQKWLSASALQDATWFFYQAVLHAAVVATWVTLLAWSCRRYLAFVPIPDFGVLPISMRLLIFTLLVDLCMWVQHRVNHAVPWFWQLHKIHHSQQELTFFTDFRYHRCEYLVRETFLAIPLIVLGIRVPTIVYFSVLRRWYTPFYHANIKADFGPQDCLTAQIRRAAEPAALDPASKSGEVRFIVRSSATSTSAPFSRSND
jgi:sterol desaturase/sphingolipid hydroxylase (fatty acid hydroxylase superfamily)